MVGPGPGPYKGRPGTYGGGVPGGYGSGQPGYGYAGGTSCTNRRVLVKDMTRIESLMKDMKEHSPGIDQSFKGLAHLYTGLISGITSFRL